MPFTTTTDERRASLDAALAAAPAEAWLFVYGSMLDGPPFGAPARAVATLFGFTRGFTLMDPLRRGTPEQPGLVLGLEAGGTTTGLAFRLPPDLHAALEPVWEQEMLLPFYAARWLPVRIGGREACALGFVSLPGGPLHVPGLSRQAQAQRIAAAAGEAGSSADYLFKVCRGLRAAGIPDPALDGLAADVHRRQAKYRSSSRS